jgi:hypothetical protein
MLLISVVHPVSVTCLTRKYRCQIVFDNADAYAARALVLASTHHMGSEGVHESKCLHLRTKLVLFLSILRGCPFHLSPSRCAYGTYVDWTQAEWSSPCSDAGHDDADYEEGPVQGKEILAVQPSRFSALLQS